MGQEHETQQVVGVRVRFVFRIVPVGFFLVIVRVRLSTSPEEEFVILRVSETEFMFLRRMGVPEVIIVM